MDCVKRLSDALETVKEAAEDLALWRKKHGDELHWYEKQLSSMVAELEGLLADLEAGMIFSDFPTFGDADIELMVEDLEERIVIHQQKIKSMKAMVI